MFRICKREIAPAPDPCDHQVQAWPVNGSFRSVRRLGWKYFAREAPSSITPRLTELIRQRLGEAPPLLMEFLQCVTFCEAIDQQKWFFTADDYARDSGAFNWNFIETEFAVQENLVDPLLRYQTGVFWEQHLPLGFNVSSDYEYIALRRNGEVVLGTAPELEDPVLLARNYEEMWTLIEGSLHQDPTPSQKHFLDVWTSSSTDLTHGKADP